MGRLFRREYGATPLHLALGGFSFALAAFAVWQLTALPAFWGVILWLGAAVLTHDLVVLPIYSVIGRAGISLNRWWTFPLWPADREDRAMDALNHIRIPAAISAILLLLFFPLIFGVAAESFERTTAMTTVVYLGRWLAITCVLFAVSGLVYAVRRAAR